MRDIHDIKRESALDLIRAALSNDEVGWYDIPTNARFWVRREIEYVDTVQDYARWGHPAAHLAEVHEEYRRWLVEVTTADVEDDPELLSRWDDTTRLTAEVTYDLYDITKADLPEVLSAMAFENGEPIAGTLADIGQGPMMYPAAQRISGPEEWNVGGWSPVHLATDTLVLT